MAALFLVALLLTNLRSLFKHSLSLLSALVWAGSLSVCGCALARSTDDANISRLINTGQIKAARMMLEAGNPSQADQVFFEARILKAQRRLPEAINSYRKVLQIDPNYINARRELAHTLLLNREYGLARFHFEALLKIDQNDRMRDGYHGFLKVIDQNRPMGLSGYFSILPSSNVNRGTTNTVFDTGLGQFAIAPSSRAESGVGVQLSFAGFFRQKTKAQSRISLNWGISGTSYEEDRYNSAIGNVAVSYEQITKSGTWYVGPYYRMTWREDDADSNALGLRFGLNHRLDPKIQFSFALSHEDRDYSVQDYQDGDFSSASYNLSYQISTRLSVSGGFAFERSLPGTAHLQYDSEKTILGLSKAWKNGLQTSFGFEYGRRDFAGVFPLTSTTRSDTFSRINVSAQHTRLDISGFTPQLSCSYTLNQSNIAFHDFNAAECQVTISHSF
jgi:hypothetical protein